MPKASPIITSFDGGELSPLIGGRVDLAKFANGCYLLENFLPLVQGPARRRGGTRYVVSVKDSTLRTWLIRFQVAERLTYMIEFGHLYARFYANRGQLMDGGVPVEIATPYTFWDLTDVDGTCRLRVTQSNDVLYIFHRRHQTRKLSRTGATTFSLDPVNFQNGPFQDLNKDEGVTITATGETGTVTLNASAPVFQASDVGSLFYLEQQDLSAVKPWVVHAKIDVGDLRRVDSRVYVCTQVGPPPGVDPPPPLTGNVTPTHTEGRAWDGDGVDVADDGPDRGPIGVEWEYLHSGWGIVRITGFTDSQTVTADVVSRLPGAITATATNKWARALFSGAEGWAEHGVFWRNRLVVARDRTIALSVNGDFENFAAKEADEVTPDSAIRETLNARQLNRIMWLAESENLIIGTNGDEWLVGPIQATQALGPSNIRAERRTRYGSKGIVPIEIGSRLLFVQASGRKLRDFEYNYTVDDYVSNDTTKLADHVSAGHASETLSNGIDMLELDTTGIVDMACQQEPYSIIWAARGDGQLIAQTYDREIERSDVYGWHRHPMVNGFVECVETMPSPDGTRDDLWMVVRREVDGQTVRYVEIMQPELGLAEPQNEAFYVDCGLTYRGAPATTISGLEHLEGQEVAVLVDGAAHPRRTVQDGAITLQVPGSLVHAGIPQVCAIEPMELNAGSADGTAQGKTKRITNVVIRFWRSLGGKAGPADPISRPAGAGLQVLSLRKPSDPMNQPVPLFSGDFEIPWDSGYERQARMRYENDQPLPVTILAIMPILHVQDDR
ncbi:hypothetical protein [Pigmentiphaga daeguensis]|uniref:Phage tail protein n=1 Tax=Pigmentiphaga daeguensis TaxID=414049 RepID=A0ABN1BSK5_9BURK